jgi:ATP-grasp ribosomal peptide maturase
MTVLILATANDVAVDRVLLMLTERGVPVVRCDTADIPHSVSLSARFSGGQWAGTLRSGPRTVDLAEIRSIWNRGTRRCRWPAGMSEAECQHADLETRLAFGGVLADLPVRWINHPGAQADADYKPRQLRTAASCGLEVPDTLITSDPAEARAFAAAGPTVIKPLGMIMLIDGADTSIGHTHLLTDDDLADLSGIELGPHMLQRWVDKEHEIRLTVVGEELFAAQIRAGTQETRIDWRRDSSALTYTVSEIPPEVRAGVLGYLKALGLRFAAFDFVVRPDDRWVFLEANTAGQYGWIEHETGAPISRALADELAGGPGGKIR